MPTRLLHLVLSLAIAAPALLMAGPSAAAPTIRCELNQEAGKYECWYVDENGDPWVPPAPPPAKLNLISDDRKVENSGSQCFGEGYTDPCTSAYNSMRPSSSFADFDGQAWAFETGAFQASHVREDELHLEGNVYKGQDADLYFAYSSTRFNVGFDVDANVQYGLDWLFTGYVDAPDFYVLEDGIRIFDWGDVYTYEGRALIDLVAGRSYSLYFQFDSNRTYGYDGGDYDITFTAVPEPGTAVLIGVGCALLGWRRRR